MGYKKRGYVYANVGIKEQSEVLEDLDELADAFGGTRADAYRILAVAFSRAKRGKWQPLWAFVNGLSLDGHALLGNHLAAASSALPSSTTDTSEEERLAQEAQRKAQERRKKLTKFYKQE